MRSRLLNLMTAASLLLCAVAAVAWAVSLEKLMLMQVQWGGVVVFNGDELPLHHESELMIERGALSAYYRTTLRPPTFDNRGRSLPANKEPLSFSVQVKPRENWVGSAFPLGAWEFSNPKQRYVGGGTFFRIRHATIPVWAIVIVCSVLPASRIIQTCRKRARQNCCQTCSYDLTGNPSGVCPECGTSVGVRARA